MCSDDCKCYAGPKNETYNLWQHYGDDKLKVYNRVFGPKLGHKMETKEDENGKKYEVKRPLWPFQWTYDRDKGVTTF
jgi:hypothetical protein